MKRLSFLQSLLLVVLAFVVIDRGLAIITAQVLSKSGDRFAQLYAGKIETDIAILGNSRALRTVDARILGEALCRPARNISAVNFDRLSVETMTLDYIGLNKKPAAVMIEASALLRPGSTIIWRMSPWRQAGTMLDERLSALESGSVPWHALIHMSRYNSDLFLKALRQIGKPQDDKPNHVSSVMDEEGAKQSAFWPKRQQRAQEFLGEVDNAVTTLNNIVARLKEQGVQVIVFLAPYHGLSPERQMVIPALRAKLAENKQIIFYDGSGLYEDPILFSDLVHVNKAGTVAYMDWLLQKPEMQALSACPK